MKDVLGNKLEPGQLVLWNNMPVRIKEVDDGGISLIEKGGQRKSPAKLVFEFTIFDPQPASIIRVVDPEAERLISAAMEA
jgi:hypothetical protein